MQTSSAQERKEREMWLQMILNDAWSRGRATRIQGRAGRSAPWTLTPLPSISQLRVSSHSIPSLPTAERSFFRGRKHGYWQPQFREGTSVFWEALWSALFKCELLWPGNGHDYWPVISLAGFPGSSAGKESACNAGDPALTPGSGRSPGEGKGCPLQYSWASLVVQTVKNPPAMQETWV